MGPCCESGQLEAFEVPQLLRIFFVAILLNFYRHKGDLIAGVLLARTAVRKVCFHHTQTFLTDNGNAGFTAVNPQFETNLIRFFFLAEADLFSKPRARYGIIGSDHWIICG